MTPTEIDSLILQFDSIIATLPTTRKAQVEAFIEKEGERYFTSPASSSLHKHDAEPGGLLAHSIAVYRNLLKFRDFMMPEIPHDSVVVCGLFHDLGKIGSLDGKDMYTPVSETWRFDKGYRYDYNKKITDGLSHAQRSVRILSFYGIDLTDDEYAAILYHDGLYLKENELFKQVHSRLALLLHWADYYTAFFEAERK